MLPQRPTASDELVQGYLVAADLAAKRRVLVESRGDEVEVKAWHKVESYCRMMANFRFADEPETLVNYMPMDERIVDKRVLSEIMQDADTGNHREWTVYHQMAYTAAMALLTPKERAICEMYYGAQMRRRDIAECLGDSPRAVDKAIERARRKWSGLRD